MRILLGTRNKGKLLELTKALSDLSATLVSPEALGITHDPEEHGETFEDNALLKARFYHGASNALPTVADDSGIIVEALADELGVQTRRWGAGKDATDAEWIAHFLKRMEREENRRARFVSTIAYIDPRGDAHVFEGVCDGVITSRLRGEYLPGLPLRSCFMPDGFDRVLSEMTYDEERTVNHRYKSIALLHRHLSSLLP